MSLRAPLSTVGAIPYFATTMTSPNKNNNLLLYCPDQLWEKVLSFVQGADTLRLACTCQTLATRVDAYDQWRTHVQADFIEGDRLVQAVERRGNKSSVSCCSWKRIYQGFLLRHSLPATASRNSEDAATAEPTLVRGRRYENQYNHVTVSWRGPMSNQQAEKDVNALVFLVRFWNCPDSVGLLKWEDKKEEPGRRGDILVIDDEWRLDWDEEQDKTLEFPDLENKVCRWISPCEGDEELNDDSIIVQHVRDTYRLTVHVLDLETGQVLTLLENATASDAEELYLYPTMYDYANEPELRLWGLPSPASPYYQALTKRNLESILSDTMLFDEYPKVESLQICSQVTLGRFMDWRPDYDDGVYLETIDLSALGDTSSIRSRYNICNYLRTLMRSKCVQLPYSTSGNSGVEDAAPVSQPIWMKEKKILDAIVAFIPFDWQATTLRLVCKQFKAAAVRAMADKVLDQTWLPFAFQRYDPASWFRADARRGWSPDMNSRESVVEYTLWQLSCRCSSGCTDKEECPGMKATDAPFFVVHGNQCEFNKEEARRQLTAEGEFLPYNDSSSSKKRRRGGFTAEIDFRRESGECLFQLCDRVCRNIKKEVGYYYLPGSLVQHYGIELNGQDISSKRFLRMLFLVFTDGASTSQGHFPEITVASSHVNFETDGSYLYSRKKVLFRFHTALNEPVELCLESRHFVY